MADTKLSALPTLAVEMADTDLVYVDDGGVSKSQAYSVLKAAFATAAQGSTADTALQPADVGTAAAEDIGFFATAAQGSTADTALQPADVGTAAAMDTGFFATAAQGATADTALQDVVEDLTPQLGGNLDVNGKDITSATTVRVDGTGFVVKLSTVNAYLANASGLYPALDSTYDLGLNNTRWKTFYTDRISVNEYVYLSQAYQVGNLPSAAVANNLAAVDDALAPVNGSVVVGGGAVNALVYADGTNWRVVSGGTQPVAAVYNNQVGTTYTIQASDAGKIITCNNAASIAVTLPDGLAVNFQCTVIQVGAGVPTITRSGTDTVNGAATGVAPNAQWKALYLSKYDTAKWLAIL